MRIGWCISIGVFSLSAAFSTYGQSASQATTPIPAGIIQSLGELADQPASHTGFVFDRSMLQAARNILTSGDAATSRAAASISSVSFDTYRYSQPAIYSPSAIARIVSAYKVAGWKHLVDNHGGNAISVETGQRRGTTTDLWLHFTGTDIDGVTVLARNPKDMNLVQVACDLKPIDLLHLSGHFGIPKIDPSAVMVPADR